MRDQAVRQSFDTIVVGAGLAGMATFYALAKSGQAVLLIEGSDRPGMGASFANGGLLTSSMSDPWNGPGVAGQLASSLLSAGGAIRVHWSQLPRLVPWGVRFLRHSLPDRHVEAMRANYRLAQFSVMRTADILQAIGQGDKVKASGSLKVFTSHDSMVLQRAKAEKLSDLGFEFEELGRADIFKMEPCLAGTRTPIESGLYFPADKAADAFDFCQTLLAEALAASGEAIFQTKVTGIRVGGGCVRAVETSAGPIEANSVVICCGSQTNLMPFPRSIRLPIAPAKGYSLSIDTAKWNECPTVPLVDDERHIAITPLSGKLRVVGGAEFAGHDPSVDDRQIALLKAALTDMYPHLAAKLEASITSKWAGLRPMSADGCPIIGESEVRGLWFNVGHGHLGWTLAMGSADLLTALILREQPPVDPRPFSLKGRI